MDLSGIIKQLITERDRLNSAIAALEGVSGGASRKGSSSTKPSSSTKRTMSAASRAKIAAAQRARWAKVKTKRKTT
jgi:hypothetical protein